MLVTLNKAIHYIQLNIEGHVRNGHNFKRRGRINPSNRVPTELDLNEVILLILEYLKLEVDDDNRTLVPMPKRACDSKEIKKAITIKVGGLVHLSTSKFAVNDHVLRPITEVTCPHCLEVLKGGAV